MHAQPYLSNGKQVYSTAYYLSVDCQNGLYRLHFQRLLDQNSKTIRDFPYGDARELVKVRPNSAEAASVNYVCQQP